MNKVHVDNLDLNLLRIFHAVMLEQHVTRASETLYLSQSAVSHAMGRLRHVLKDELFIKVPGGVRPTARAAELWPAIRQALQLLEDAINPVQFDPATSSKVFRVACHDYFALVVLPRLQKHLQQEAPSISVRCRPTGGRAFAQLDEQDIDCAISAFGALPERFNVKPLLEDNYVCLMDKSNPLVNTLDIKHYARARHILVSPRGDDKGFVDDVLAKQGLTRHIALVVNQFSPVGSIISGSDLIVTLPKHVAMLHVHMFNLHIEPCPVQASEGYIQTKLVWHQHYSAGQAFDWFVKTVSNICRDL